MNSKEKSERKTKSQKWTEEDDELLRNEFMMFQDMESCDDIISTKFPDRTPAQVYSHIQ